MKPNTYSQSLLVACAVAFALTPLVPALGQEAAEHAEHEAHEKIAGPHGGRVITSVEPHLEFLVTDERKIEVRAVNEEGEVVPLGEQQLSVVGGDRSNPTRLSFAREKDVLVSDKAVPEGDMIPVVVQIKPGADAKPVIERFTLNLADCPSCDFLEYACVCDHDSHEGHDH